MRYQYSQVIREPPFRHYGPDALFEVMLPLSLVDEFENLAEGCSRQPCEQRYTDLQDHEVHQTVKNQVRDYLEMTPSFFFPK